MAQQLPMVWEQSVPAAQEGQIVTVWSGGTGLFRDMDSIFDALLSCTGFGPGSRSLTRGAPMSDAMPTADIEEAKDAYIFEIDLPGARSEHVAIEAGAGELHIYGQIPERPRAGMMRHQSRRSGPFSFRVAIPPGTDWGAITAEQRDGVLTIVMPRSPESMPRLIDVA